MFSMKLTLIEKIPQNYFHMVSEKEYDYVLDNEISVICDICTVFKNSKLFKFEVSGFGEIDWKVDFWDLSTIIEQIPEIIKKIKSNSYNFVLDFYEQGIQRELSFIDLNENVKIICKSRTDWMPNPEFVFISKKQIEKTITDLYNDFIMYANMLCEKLAKNSMFVEFMKA